MKDIFEQMGLPESRHGNSSLSEIPHEDFKTFRMMGAEDTEEEFEEPVKHMHPEVKSAMAKKASADLEKAGIKKGDPRHASLLDIELMLRLSQAEENFPGIQAGLRNKKIRQIWSKWGSRAPKILAALGLSHKDAPKPVSKAEVLLSYMKKKEAQQAALEDKKLKGKILETNLDMKRMALQDKLLRSQELREEKKQKELDKPVKVEVSNRIKAIDNEVRDIDKWINDMGASAGEEQLAKVIQRRKDLLTDKSKMFKINRISDTEKKKDAIDILNRYTAERDKGL